VIADLAPWKTLHAFDTFEGIPHDDDTPEGHKRGDFTTNLTDGKDYLRLNDVSFHVGFFPETAKGLEDRRFCFAHIDGDLYETTKAAIEFFVPRMVPGGIIVFDDWKWERCPGVERAIREAGLEVTEGEKQAWWIR
jgi:O-methyltransferase